MSIIDIILGKKKRQSGTARPDENKVETSNKLSDSLDPQVINGEKCIQLNLKLVHFLASCGSMNKDQLATMKNIIYQSGLPASYTQNMLTTTDMIERSLGTLLPHHLDEWRVKTATDLSKEIPVFLEVISKIDPQRAVKIGKMIQTKLAQIPRA